MELSIDNLKQKEVIVACSGRKLGYPTDFILNCECGKLEAIILCGKGFFRREEMRIPWCDVERIGEDIIWVCKEPVCR